MRRRLRDKSGKQRGQPFRSVSKLAQPDNQGSRNDPDADFGCAADGDFEDLVGRRDRCPCDDDQSVARQHGGVGREVPEERGNEGTGGGPNDHYEQESRAILWEDSRQGDGGDCADGRPYQSKCAFQYRRTDHGLTDDGGRRPSPGRGIELELEGDEQRERYCGGQPNSMQQRLSRSMDRTTDQAAQSSD